MSYLSVKAKHLLEEMKNRLIELQGVLVAGSSHNHDDLYYQESEVDSYLAGKADDSHLHDDRYYTESEITSYLANKSDISHNHDLDYSDIDHDHDSDYEPLNTKHYVTPIQFVGALGAAAGIGNSNVPVVSVLFSDNNALITTVFHVEAGEYKIRLVMYSDANNSGKTMGGNVTCWHRVDGETQSSPEINASAWDIALDNTDKLIVEDFGTTITVGDGETVCVYYQKDDTAGGASGNAKFIGIFLVPV